MTYKFIGFSIAYTFISIENTVVSMLATTDKDLADLCRYTALQLLYACSVGLYFSKALPGYQWRCSHWCIEMFDVENDISLAYSRRIFEAVDKG